jgi:hypothetical protein
MWATNVICTVIGVVLMIRVQRSGATARGGDWHETLDGLKSRIAAFRSRRGSAGGGPAAAAAP